MNRLAAWTVAFGLAACGVASEPTTNGRPDRTEEPTRDAGRETPEDTSIGDVDASTDVGMRRDAPDVERPNDAASDGAVEGDGGRSDAASSPDAGRERTPLRTEWPRGLQWVRNHPMFVSGLNVRMDGVTQPFVDAYYDDFGANAIHLWELGVPHRLDDWLAAPRDDHRWLSWLRADGRTWTNEQVAGGMPANSPGRVGYQIGDEPRTWDAYEEMMEGAARVRAHDPDALVFLNMTFHADELDQMMVDQCNDPTVDLFSFDNYQMSQDAYQWLEYFRDWGLQCDKPYWRYLRSFGHSPGEIPTATDMRWHAFVGLVYGYTGHSWFLYQIPDGEGLIPALFQTPGDISSARTPLFDVAAAINEELVNYGRVITRLTSTDVRYLSALGGVGQPDGTDVWEVGAGNDPYIVDVEVSGGSLQDGLIGFFRDNYGERYVMLQNPNHESGSFPVSTDQTATFTLTFDFAAAPSWLDASRVERFDAASGQVSEVTLGGGTKLEVSVPAGDVYLFKYATGAPWAMQ